MKTTKQLLDLVNIFAEAHGADMSNVPVSDQAGIELLAAINEVAMDAARYQHLKDYYGYSYSMQPDSPAEHGIEYQWQQGTYEERNNGLDLTIDLDIESKRKLLNEEEQP